MTNNLPSDDSRSSPRTTEIPWKLAFRLFRWSTYATAAITLVLLFHKSPPPDIQVTPQAAARVDEKFQQVEQAVANGQPAAMHMDQTELNSYLASHLELPAGARLQYAAPAANTIPTTTANAPSAIDAPAMPANATAPENGYTNPSMPSAEDIDQMRSNVKDVKVQLVGDRLRAYVVFDVHGKDMTLQLEGKLGSESGYIRFEPLSGQIGALPLPLSALQNAVQHLMDSPENREKLRLPADVTNLKIENGEVVTTYK
jgi:hypothetical protein